MIAPASTSTEGRPTPEESPVEVIVHVFRGTESLPPAESSARFLLPPGTFLIGKDPSCHLLIDADRVEPMHARLSFLGHRLIIEDLESQTGVHIGGVRLRLPTPVQPGTEVHIGSVRLLFEFTPATRERIQADLEDPHLGLKSIREELSAETHEILGKLAEGGMGMILSARDRRLQRSVAMKVLQEGQEFSAEKLVRFVSEAQLTGQLEHPNIVPVYQMGVSLEGRVFYTMKYVRGETLESVLARLRSGDVPTLRKYPLPALISVFMKVADALAFAHSRGVIHRDLKPGNLMIGAFGEVLIMDWGLAKRLAEPASPDNGGVPSTPPTFSRSPAEINLSQEGKFQTLHGLVVGTPPYLSPEQATADAPVDTRSDIHVMGSILYEMLALRPPMESARDPERMMAAIRRGAFIPLEERILLPEPNGDPPPKLRHLPGAKIPEGLAAIVAKAMQRDPALRYLTVEDLQTDILAYQGGFAPAAQKAGWMRQLQLLLGRRRREATIAGIFLLFSQALLAYFLGEISADRKTLRTNEKALASKNLELNVTNQRLEQIVYQLRSTAERNYRDAAKLLQEKRPNFALSQINLALVGVADSPKTQARYLIIRGHANTQLGFYAEALEDYRQVASVLPASIPLSEIETDLSRAFEDGFRPQDGWPWEKAGLPEPPPKSRPLPKNQTVLPPEERQRLLGTPTGK